MYVWVMGHINEKSSNVSFKYDVFHSIWCVSSKYDMLICDMTHLFKYDMPSYVIWLTHSCCVTCLIHIWHSAVRVWHASLTRDIVRSYVWRDPVINSRRIAGCVTWLFHIRDMTLSYMWHDSFIYVTRLFHIRDTTLSYMWHDSFIYVTWLFLRCNITLSDL